MTSDTFSSGIVWFENLFRNPLVVAAATYGTVLYQVGFAFVLLTRLHLPWVMFGVALHSGIALVMGLLTFGTIMTALVLFTVSDREWRTLRVVSRRIARFVKRRSGSGFVTKHVRT
jgi:hypothetical protein